MTTKTKINPEVIRNLNDEQLDAIVYNKAIDKYLGTFGERFTDNEQDKLLCEMLACSILNSEVNNGGFDQFFLNSKDLAKAALKGLEKIKAEKHRELLLLATKTYEEQKDHYKGKRNPNYSQLDERYYELEELAINLQKFIKENIEKFYD